MGLNMKYLYFLLIGGTVMDCCPQSHSAARVRVSLGEVNRNKEIRMFYQDSSYMAVLDSNGMAVMSIAGKGSSGYATLFTPRSIKELYLENGKDLDITVTEEGKWQFEGTGKAINEYLNCGFITTLGLDARKAEGEFIEDWKKLPEKMQNMLDATPLPDMFKQLETKRLHYMVCNMLLDYPLHHARQLKLGSYLPGESYYTHLQSVMREDSLATELWVYRQAFKNWLSVLVDRQIGETSPFQRLNSVLTYAAEKIKGKKLSEFLIYTFLCDYMQHYGVEDMKELYSFYRQRVNTSSMSDELERLYAEYSRLVKGEPAPSFCLADVSGRKVCLSDFKGRYVYIDIWASWCRPCCRELPELKRIEALLKDRKIAFVGISLDQERNAWIKKLEKERIEGIQLHIGNDQTFRKNYKIGLIPRFILIDQEGKILDVNMTRPSDPETLRRLDALPGM